jgi:hypothetical protein
MYLVASHEGGTILKSLLKKEANDDGANDALRRTCFAQKHFLHFFPLIC